MCNEWKTKEVGEKVWLAVRLASQRKRETTKFYRITQTPLGAGAGARGPFDPGAELRPASAVESYRVFIPIKMTGGSESTGRW